jgi:hypothetical protein
MRTASIHINGEEIARAQIRDDIDPSLLAIVILKAIRDVPLPRKQRSDAGATRKPKIEVLPPAANLG